MVLAATILLAGVVVVAMVVWFISVIPAGGCLGSAFGTGLGPRYFVVVLLVAKFGTEKDIDVVGHIGWVGRLHTSPATARRGVHHRRH